MSKPLYVIRRDGHGSGGFLCPPGHPAHFYCVEGYWGGRRKPSGPDLMAGLDYLIRDEYGDIPDSVKARAQKIMDSAKLTCSEAYVRNVYGYFRNSYSPDGTDKNVSHAISAGKIRCACGQESWRRAGLAAHLEKHASAFTAFGVAVRSTPGHGELPPLQLPATHHLGYLCVQEYFPDHEPRLDLIADPGNGYGAHDCAKCGTRVQYEARHDAWCEVKTSPWRWLPDCPAGGKHEVPA